MGYLENIYEIGSKVRKLNEGPFGKWILIDSVWDKKMFEISEIFRLLIDVNRSLIMGFFLTKL